METEMKRQGRPGKILIIDDSEINRDILEMIFSSEYLIEKAENGKEGLKKLMESLTLSVRCCWIL